MTEQLKTLMHAHADSVDFAMPDLEAMTRAGDRRRRSRRTALVGGVAALGVGAAFLVPGIGAGGDHTGGPATATPAAPRAEVTYAVGSTLHIGDESVDVGHEISAYVRTADGYAFTDPDGTVWSWLGGEAIEVGTTDARRPRLVADDEGTLVAWVDRQQPAVVVLDQGTGETWPLAESRPSYVYALDGRTAYWRDDRGAVAVDVDSVASRVIDARAKGTRDILAVEDGLVAFQGGADGPHLGTSPDDGITLPDVYGSVGAFSPDAAWFTIDADDPLVYDAHTGEQVAFDLDYGFAAGYEWLDESTVVMVAGREPNNDAQAVLLTCTVPAGTCEEATGELGTFTELVRTGFTLPTGEPVDE